MINRDEFIRSEIQGLIELCDLWLQSNRSANSNAPFVLQIKTRLHGLNEMTTPAQSLLTAKEKTVLFHVSQGYTNKEIASGLGVSEKTVEFHLKNILQKTDASTRTEAVANAMKKGWLT